MSVVRLGTRGSLLALTQSGWVASGLRELGLEVEKVVFQTKGDRVLDRPLPEIGGKGLFTEEIDRALLDGTVDLAVHSLKDLPTEAVPGLFVACIPEREDPRDVLVGPPERPAALRELPPGAVVGTSSLRRRALLRAFRPDLRVEDVRGNLDTRLRKLDEGGYDAILVAAAGLLRLGLSGRIDERLERTAWLPAAGQGALAVVAREDSDVLGPLALLHHAETASAVKAERALLGRLEGGCQVPVGALAIPYDGGLRLWGLVASPDGRYLVRADATGSQDAAEELGVRVADSLLDRGAAEILQGIGESPPAPAAP